MNQHKACGCGNKHLPCGCCAGVEAVTPLSVANRPGLSALNYRTGTHATFLETMQARLSTTEVEHDGQKFRPLRELTTREPDDPSIALLDAWATVADVLTFYQERVANEGYLRTATERRSILELARLVGYRLRPGVAASVYLALTLEDAQTVLIEPYQVRAQSVPGPGELPQTFENIEKLEARGRWNTLKPRLTQPLSATVLSDKEKTAAGVSLYFKGTTTGLNENDPLLVAGGSANPALFRVIQITPDNAADRTEIVIKPWVQTPPAKQALHALVGGFGDPGAAAKTLNTLTSELSGTKSDAELADHIESETLPGLERITARKNISAALRSRVSALADDIAEATTALRASAFEGEPISETNLQTVSASDDELTVVMRGPATKRDAPQGLTKPESLPPANLLRLDRTVETAFATRSDLGLQALGLLQPSLRANLTIALGNVAVTPKSDGIEVYAFRVKASPFGHNAPLRSKITETDTTSTTNKVIKDTTVTFDEWKQVDVEAAEEFLPAVAGVRFSTVIYLDGNYDKIKPDSWVVVDTSAADPTNPSNVQPAHDPPPLIVPAAKVQAAISRGAYGITGKSSRIQLKGATNDAAWIKIIEFVPGVAAAAAVNKPADDFQVIRRTVVYAQAERLTLAEAPIRDPICANKVNQGWIRLDGVYSELKSGRWVIVSGVRSDVVDRDNNPIGVQSSELAMLSEVVHDSNGGAPGESDPIPGDSIHTRIRFASALSYCYRRDNVTIYANVAKATHGESRTEALGSGDGSKPFQQFTLRQPPLTYVSAANPAGVESTLKIFVNEIQWHEAESTFGLQPSDRRFVTTRSDAEVTTAIFGNGKRGSRLPTGQENVRAEYRQGIGKGGNVAAEKITLLAARPLGVKEVINPRPASGGADPESRDQARKNAPLAVLALDRLVSTPDYSDFARTFGGVGKAFAARLSDGRREMVHVTIAGAGDAPIEESSDLFLNLHTALTQFGDPVLPIGLAVRELLLLVISAKVRLLPDYVWEKVAPRIRAKLLDTFSFENRELGQDVFLSEVISAIQSIEGVAYVDVDAFGGLGEKNPDGTVRTPNELIAEAQKIVKGPLGQRLRVNLPGLPKSPGGQIQPAQLAYLPPEVPDTLILNLIKGPE
jgi:hypothetical protein